MSTLITGGAGFIGSHLVRLLASQGEPVIVLDDLSAGIPSRIPDAPLVQLDLAAEGATDQIAEALRDHDVDAVIHVAGRKQVGESLQRPGYYYRQNVGGMINLLDAMQRSAVHRMVFSSSAAVYGSIDVDLVDEALPCAPLNPYGESKLVGEWMANRAPTAWGLRAASLRYFNVAGAGANDLGDKMALNLIPIVFNHAISGEPPVVFGDDFPTPDGTGIRDYVHVQDLAEAHLAALTWTGDGPADHRVFNIGTGHGASVFEVINEIARTSGHVLNPVVVGRRSGDPARVVADVSRAHAELGWAASRGIDQIIGSAWSAFDESVKR